MDKVQHDQPVPRAPDVVTYDPRLPAIPAILKKNWKLMLERDQRLKPVFGQPPICSTRRGPNLASHLLRAKLQKLPLSLTRAATGDRVVGVRKCGVGGRRQSCPLCPHLGHAANNPRAVVQEVTIYHSGAVITINQNLKCTDYGVIYLLSCTKPLCRKQYIGETGRPAYVRFKEHLDSAEDPGTTTPVGQHFQSAGHSKTDMVMIPFEKVKGDRATRKQRERFFINNNNLITHGLNLNL
jgi:hypothetical protein